MVTTDEGKPSTRAEQAWRLAESMRRQLGALCGLLAEPDLVGHCHVNRDWRAEAVWARIAR